MDLRGRVEICASTQCEWLQIIVRVSKAVVVNTLFNMLIIFFKKNTNSAFEITHKYFFRNLVIK